MSNKSNNLGRAYEFAWINVLYDNLKDKINVQIIQNSSYEANKKAWNTLDKQERETYLLSANAAVNTILELEPKLADGYKDILTFEFQKDKFGQNGDVRDIVIKKNYEQWEIGLSIKHNYDAVKHSRLSYKLDFGKKWYNVPCSEKYWYEVTPIFDKLIKFKKENLKWSDLSDKEDSVYMPLLDAFINEIKRAYFKDTSVARKTIEYLIGIKDYYKIISVDRKRLTLIRTFNMHGTLNKKDNTRISSVTVPIVDLPSELIEIRQT